MRGNRRWAPCTAALRVGQFKIAHRAGNPNVKVTIAIVGNCASHPSDAAAGLMVDDLPTSIPKERIPKPSSATQPLS